MYLKSIEVHGFKSFANKLLFEFNNGITGIVGPNGSGKSNVADAVRWVLGEQSAKQLRGSSMQDVIFSGTQMRKPQSYAYVALTIANDDHSLDVPYEEVQIARRVYRSGESEYLLNGTACRLKDVQELFFDTGVGKEGYSIIGQGQIDKILSGKPDDRRELFDEAAGIVKFKKRKATAEKNLEAERQNLVRIEDILTELEKQVEPLKEQSEQAKEYLELKHRLKTLDINLFRIDYESLNKEIEEIKEDISNTDNELENAKKERDSSKDEYEKAEKIIEDFDRSVEDKKENINKNTLRISNCESEIKLAKEKISSAEQGKEYYLSREQTLNDQINEANDELKGYKDDLDKSNEHLKKLKDKEDALTLEIEKVEKEIVDKEIRLDEENDAIMDSINRTQEITLKQERLRTSLEQNNLKKAELNKQIISNRSRVDEAVKIMKHEEESLNLAKSEYDDEYLAQKEIYAKIDTERNIIARTNHVIDEKRGEYHRINSRLETLKNMAERYEGYNPSIRKVMEQKKVNAGIIGVVADVISVEKKFETAVEVCLGGNIQNIITNDEKSAKEMIEILKADKAGRATFLPLTTVTPNTRVSWDDEVFERDGVYGVVSDFVKRDEKYDDVIRYLLGRYLMVDTYDRALAINKDYGFKLRIVTLEGELMNPGGSISGGAFKNKNHLLGRTREIDNLKSQMKKIEDEIEQYREEINISNEQIDALSAEADEKSENLNALDIRQKTAKFKYDQAVTAKEQTEREHSRINNEKNDLEKEKKDIESALDDISLKLGDSRQSEDEAKDQVKLLNTDIDKAHDELSDKQDKLNEIRLNISSEQQKAVFFNENINRITESVETAQGELRNLQKEQSQSDANVEEYKNQIASYKEQIEKIKTENDKLEDDVKKAGTQREDLIKSRQQVFDKRDALISHIGELDKERFRLENRETNLNEKLDSRIEYMWDEYEITYHGAQDIPIDESISYTRMKSLTGEIRGKIKALGAVNVNAIEDYKNTYDRFTLLSTQRDDLVKSEEKLRQIIEDLDTQMRNQFREKFVAIQNQFDAVFKELFGGGKGTLELIEDEDVLEAGIVINAQPPGKKLTNMMQLSGGEKALTAIALLFAIQNLKPSPFCLLDEIEAALDDSNVKRYAKYLHKLTKHTQFIVITHRKGTMEAADVLYGITMQEKGVSTLVSVKLIEEQLDN